MRRTNSDEDGEDASPVSSNGHATRWLPETDHSAGSAHKQAGANVTNVNHEYIPGGKKALDAIALRAALLGIAFGVNAGLTVALLAYQKQVWRGPFFLLLLSLFHTLEFYVTARYNPRFANISAFLLSQGKEYNLAHMGALTECLATAFFFPNWQLTVSRPSILALGLLMTVLGQIVRTTAMAQAGTNFNHTVQTQRNEGHQLVTRGVYHWLRHPSYFGFFWWGLGTQLVLGNAFCFLAYALILWSFFNKRIRSEEAYLLKFFGDDYARYRAHSFVGIPLIP